MTEPFPSKAYRELCIENADRLREEWGEPIPGDWVHRHRQGIEIVIDYYATLITTESRGYGDGSQGNKHHYTWLPRLDQLIEMLEERGWEGEVDFGRAKTITATIWPEDETIDKVIKHTGPDPACALLRAWLSLDPAGEVVKEESADEGE